MKTFSAKKLRDKKLIVFDLDGTLTESKSDMDTTTATLFDRLLQKTPVAVIGGGRYEQFQQQLIRKLRGPKNHLQNLFLFVIVSFLP